LLGIVLSDPALHIVGKLVMATPRIALSESDITGRCLCGIEHGKPSAERVRFGFFIVERHGAHCARLLFSEQFPFENRDVESRARYTVAVVAYCY